MGARNLAPGGGGGPGLSLRAAHRRGRAPRCSNGPKLPAWYRSNTGIGDNSALAVRSCVEGHAGNVLDMQLVNNRPYGLILNYGGAAIKWGRHAAPHTFADALRNGIGDAAAHAIGGLYLPPLSKASIGIVSIGHNKRHDFAITPYRRDHTRRCAGYVPGKPLATGGIRYFRAMG